ncbi:MAG: hypothetical protein QF773_01615 [Lentisphaeria bacterium]|nr:hypothetical protein [Lentisphaeria bacterium]
MTCTQTFGSCFSPHPPVLRRLVMFLLPPMDAFDGDKSFTRVMWLLTF